MVIIWFLDAPDRSSLMETFISIQMHRHQQAYQVCTHYFENGNHQITGSFIVRILIPHPSFLAFKTYIVSIDFPFVIDMYVLQEFGLCIDFKDISPKSNQQEWKIPTNFQDEHAYIQHNKTTFIC